MQQLTPELLQELIHNGFRYFLIKNVCYDPKGSGQSYYVVYPIFKIPENQVYSCTGIEDSMITTIVDGRVDHIKVYVEQQS